MALDTGHGATIAFATSGFTASFLNFTPSAQTRGSIEKGHLGTTGHMPKLPAEISDAGGFSFDYLFDPSAALPSVNAVAESITITFPNNGTTAAKLVGTGFFTEITPPTLATGEMLQGSGSVEWDAATGPSFTAEIA